VSALAGKDVPQSVSQDATGVDQERTWEKLDYVQFCQRVAAGTATPSCVMDYPYSDAAGLDLQGDARHLERMYCFHDPLKCDPSCSLVTVYVHTLLPWGDRKQWTVGRRLLEVTSVSMRQTRRPAAGGAWVEGRSKYLCVPISKNLQAWQALYTSTGSKHIAWRPYVAGCVPPGDRNNEGMYEAIRKVIQAGDSLCDKVHVVNSQLEKTSCLR